MEPVDPRRAFRLLDAMILIAATAVGFGIVRQMDSYGFSDAYNHIRGSLEAALNLGWPFRAGAWLSPEFVVALSELGLLFVPWLFALSVAVILIEWRDSGRSLRLHPVRPGMMMALAPLLAIWLVSLPPMFAWLISEARVPISFEIPSSDQLFYVSALVGGLAVIVSWMTMLRSGVWRAESNWVDRLGRLLGLLWSLASFTFWIWHCSNQIDLFRRYSELKKYSTGSTIDLRIGTTTAVIVREKIISLSTSFVPWLAFGTLVLLTVVVLCSWGQLRSRFSTSGMLAVLASMTAILWHVLPILVGFFSTNTGWKTSLDWLVSNGTMLGIAGFGGLAVLLSWLTLFLTQRWKAESTWLDRLGRGIGGVWIVALFAVSVAGILCQAE